MPFATWMELLEYARWAPSPHNIQAWLFRLESEDRATLMYNPQRLLPGTDPTGRFTAVGFGLLNETLSIAAAPLGLDVVFDYLGVPLDVNATGPQPYATMTLVKRARPESLPRQLILDRRTSRLPYHDVPVSPEVLTELSSVAATFGHVLEFSTDPKQVGWVVRLNADTMFFDMSDPVARNEVGSWIRYSRREADRKADGLAAYAMLFPGLMMKLFVRCNWLFRIPGIYYLVRALYERTMRGTRTVAWLSGDFDTPESWHRAGRMLGRLWLTMTRHGVYLHPFGSVITNKTSHARMTDHFANAEREHDLWLLVRLGHSNLPPQAQRLTVEQLLVR